MPSKHHNKKKDTKRLLFIPNSLFLVCFSSISSKFGWVVLRSLARCTGRAKIPMARPNKPDMPVKCTTRYYYQVFTLPKFGQKTMGAFHSTKKFRFEFRNFRMSNGTVFSTRPDRSRSIPALAHFPPRIARQNAEGSWWSGCLKCRKRFHLEKFKTHSEFDSSLIFIAIYERNLRTPYELSSRESMETGRSDPQEIWNDQSTIFQEIRS